MPKITMSISEDVHKILKQQAHIHGRSITKEIEFTFKKLYKLLPKEEYWDETKPMTVTDSTISIPTEINGVQVKGVQFATKNQEKEVSPIEEQIKLNKLKDQRYKWIEKTIDRLYPEYRGFSNYNEFLSANQKMYWDKPDEEFIKHIEEVKREDEYFEAHPELLEDRDDDEDLLKATPHSPEYIKIKNYFTNHCAPYEFEDVTNHARLAKEGNENSIEYIKDYYDINLHDALGSPHSYDFSDDQWIELFKILSE